MNQQQKVLVLAGGSAFVLLLGVAYFIFKRRNNTDDEEEYESLSKSRSELPDLNTSVASAAQSVAEVLVPKKLVGGIIGKNGCNIKQLKNEFAVRLDFEKEDDKIKDNPDRKLFIRGEREKVLACEKKVKELIANAPKYVEGEMFIPSEACGHVIGKGGQNIKEICDISGAKVRVEGEEDLTLGNLRRVRLLGTEDQVNYAQLLVQEKVELNKTLRAQDKFKASKKAEESSQVKEKQYETVQLPDTDGYFKVFVSAFETPDHVWIQLVNEDGLKLDALNKELTEKYGRMKMSEEQLDRFNTGTLCVAPFENDDQQYRAVIKSVNPDRTAELYYIDFGDVGRVSVDQLKKLRPEFQELPAHAVECYLPIEPLGPFWSKEAERLFQEMSKCANWIPLNARIIGTKLLDFTEYPVIDLVDTSENEINVCATLVEKQEAQWNEYRVTDSTERERQEERTIATEIEIPSLDLTPQSLQNTPIAIEEVQVVSENTVEATPDEGSFLDNADTAVAEVEEKSKQDKEPKISKVIEEEFEIASAAKTESSQSEKSFINDAETEVEGKSLSGGEPSANEAVVEEIKVISEAKVESTSGADMETAEEERVVSDGVPSLNKALEKEIEAVSEVKVEPTVGESSFPDELTNVNGVSSNETHESADSGIVKDTLIDSQLVDSQLPLIKEQKSDIDIRRMRSEKSSHSTPTPESNVSEDVSFDADEMQTEKPEAIDSVEKNHVLKKQETFDDSFVDIDVETVDGAVTAIVKDHSSQVVEEAVSPEKDVPADSSETSVESPTNELNRTLLEESDGESDLQRSLDETSRKNVAMNRSMELARENLLFIDSTDSNTDNDSFYSAKSDITVTDTDNASFMTANDRVTPTNDLSVSIPDLSSTSPYSSRTELAKAAPNVRNSSNTSGKFEIQFIDEKTHKVVSRESLTTSYDKKQNKQHKRLSAPLSPGKETTV